MSKIIPVEHRARVVVTGTTDTGRSTIVSDSVRPNWFATPAATSTLLWEAESLPVVPGEEVIPPPERILPERGGFRVSITAIPPDEEMAAADLKREALEEIGLGPAEGGRPPGFHQTPTVDIMTVISGEIYALMDDGEVLLRQGDTLIQNGTPHGWSNRSSENATLLGIVVAATEDDYPLK